MTGARRFSNQPARCRLSFFDDEGAPLAVPVDGNSVTSIEFDLGIGEQREFETSGEGEVLVGWALLESDQPVAGSLLFGLRDSLDRLLRGGTPGISRSTSLMRPTCSRRRSTP